MKIIISESQLDNLIESEVIEGKHDDKDMKKLISWAEKKLGCTSFAIKNGIKLCPPDGIEARCRTTHLTSKGVKPLQSDLAEWFGVSRRDIDKAYRNNEKISIKEQMEVVVTSAQIQRLSLKLFERIYGRLYKYKGINYDEVFVDDNGLPRIAVNHKIFESPTVLILKEDFDKFLSVMPLEPNEFGVYFKEWFEKYFTTDFKSLTTTSQSKMQYVNPIYRNMYTMD